MWIRDNSSNLFTECILCAKRSLGTEIIRELDKDACSRVVYIPAAGDRL